ncbi:MAG: dockerin type I repeat-containing protein [Prevotella sp.]|nr:dockerin type I repeat-containing protein [Prevotella sp.]
MRKLIALLLTMCVAPGVFAQLNSNGEGFYRISSQQTKRYMSLESNRFTINNSGSIPKIDMSSLTTIEAGSNQSNIVSNPASVFYIKRSKGNEYDLMSQGVNTWEMSGQRYHLTIEGNNPYDIKAIGNYKSVYVNYAISENMEHIVTPHGSSVYKWNITPIKSSDANSFFGIIPQITSGNKYYSSFYASFAFNFASAGMKAWVVDYIDYNRNIAVVKEITGIVPSATPVIIECSSPTAASNKMNLYASGGTRPANNAMEGVFFCKTGKMENFVKYNSQTMRVLGLASDGSLAFVQAPSTQLYVPANTTYLKVNKGSAGEFKIMTWDEYNASTPGDLNGDGEVDVTDVVELIDMVLAGSTDPAGDINGDGEVDVTDVVELIDMVLAG